MKLSRSSNLLMMIVVAVAAAADLANASELPATPRILRQCKNEPFWREQIPPPLKNIHPHYRYNRVALPAAQRKTLRRP